MMILINLAGLYLIIGFLFAIAFVIKGLHVIDKETIGSPVAFRVLIFPASVVLWPLLLQRWLRLKK